MGIQLTFDGHLITMTKKQKGITPKKQTKFPAKFETTDSDKKIEVGKKYKKHGERWNWTLIEVKERKGKYGGVGIFRKWDGAQMEYPIDGMKRL